MRAFAPARIPMPLANLLLAQTNPSAPGVSCGGTAQPVSLRRAVPLLGLVLALLLPSILIGQSGRTATLALRVVEQGSGHLVDNAVVWISGFREPAFTGPDGRIQARTIPAGQRTLTIGRPGYTSERLGVEFTAGAHVNLVVELVREPVRMEQISVTSQPRNARLAANGFYQRQRQGGGGHMTGEEIAALGLSTMTDVFRQMRGLVVVPHGGGSTYTLRSSRGSSSLRSRCIPPIYLNSGLVAQGGLDFVSPEHVAGVEVYPGPATVPPLYNTTGSECGVVLVWTW